MPIGNISKDSTPKRETFRPPWVKDKDAEAPPPWTQRKLKPVDTVPKATVSSDEPSVKPLKPVLKKQSTVREVSNGSSEPVEEKLVKPSIAKQADRASRPSDEKPKFIKAAIKTIEKKPTEDKPLTNAVLKTNNTNTTKAEEKKGAEEKVASTKTIKPQKVIANSDKKPAEKTVKIQEKPTLKSVKTIDDKAKENSVGITDKKVNKNDTNKANVANDITVNGKGIPNSLIKENKLDKTEKSKEEKVAMATKPPTPLEKSPSKLPPRKPLQKAPSKDDVMMKKWRDPLHERVKENIDKTLANEIPKGHTLTKNESLRSLLKPTPPPPPPPAPPKLPPPPEFKKPQLDPEKLKKIEQLRSRPRRRPDWSDMMKEVEQGRKLKHVVCNDRSQPIITRSVVVKNKGQFIFESEKPNSHNNLLKEISKGIKLKKVKTNDRSKPNLEGLRKFRRQMTIEEQVQKSMSQANLAAAPGVPVPEVPAAEEEEIDEMDDIDKVRDDLQSTKQLLAIELRNKEAQERENKRLLTRIQNLEAELARERAFIKQEQHKTVISVTDAYDERLVNSLKMEVEKAKETADSLQKQYLQAAEDRDDALTELEEVKRKNSELEKKLEQALAGIVPTNVSSRRASHAIKQLSVTKDDSFEEEDQSEEEEEESEEKKQKRLEKEVRNMRNKIRHLKEKQDNMKRERMAYKMSLKNQQAALKIEKKKYKELKREVDKMAAMMKEVGSEEDEDEEDEEEESEDEKKSGSEEEETETETEQDTESETESESEPEDAPLPKKKDNLNTRLKRHETRVNALKKGNTLLMANVDRLKDDVLKQKEMSLSLQKELDSLIEDLE
ncbi:unnamed protein product [Leptosia nina]|uniref:WH2 domain-containing protein n=1 Tax=Leptosia nina TaxID=320188 RepID=A0AAV1IXZ3_9NEOP